MESSDADTFGTISPSGRFMFDDNLLHGIIEFDIHPASDIGIGTSQPVGRGLVSSDRIRASARGSSVIE